MARERGPDLGKRRERSRASGSTPRGEGAPGEGHEYSAVSRGAHSGAHRRAEERTTRPRSGAAEATLARSRSRRAPGEGATRAVRARRATSRPHRRSAGAGAAREGSRDDRTSSVHPRAVISAASVAHRGSRAEVHHGRHGGTERRASVQREHRTKRAAAVRGVQLFDLSLESPSYPGSTGALPNRDPDLSGPRVDVPTTPWWSRLLSTSPRGDLGGFRFGMGRSVKAPSSPKKARRQEGSSRRRPPR